MDRRRATAARYPNIRNERSEKKAFPARFPDLRGAGRRVHKKASTQLIVTSRLAMSGRLDSNQRPPEPHSGALAKLRHAPLLGNYRPSNKALQERPPALKGAVVPILTVS